MSHTCDLRQGYLNQQRVPFNDGRILLLVIENARTEARIRNDCLKGSNDIVDTGLWGSRRNGDNEVHRRNNPFKIGVNVLAIDAPSETSSLHFRGGINVRLRLDDELIRGINTPSDRLAQGFVLRIEGLLEHNRVEGQVGIHMDFILGYRTYELLNGRSILLRIFPSP